MSDDSALVEAGQCGDLWDGQVGAHPVTKDVEDPCGYSAESSVDGVSESIVVAGAPGNQMDGLRWEILENFLGLRFCSGDVLGASETPDGGLDSLRGVLTPNPSIVLQPA